MSVKFTEKAGATCSFQVPLVEANTLTEIDASDVSKVWVDIGNGALELTKSSSEVTVSTGYIVVELSGEQTKDFQGFVKVVVKVLLNDGRMPELTEGNGEIIEFIKTALTNKLS